MDIARKLEYAQSLITSIGTHEDEDAAVRTAALDQVISLAAAEKAAIDVRLQERIAAAVSPAATTE